VKIALVILHADPARGGAERYTVDLAAALGRRGHEVRIVATSFGGEVPEAMRRPIDATGRTRAAVYRAFVQEVSAHTRDAHYDLIHAMLTNPHCDLYHPHAGIAADALRRRWSALFNPRRRAMAEVERELVDESRAVFLSLSEYSKADVLRHYPRLAPDRLVTLFNAVDLDRFQPSRARRDEVLSRLGIPSGRTVALIVANDFARKGLMEALRAAAAVNQPDRLALVVVGKQDVTLYRREAEKMRHVARIVFAGAAADARPI
jgi:glycosyltransferase involved in cell wall biosynthesis